jgi:hypothetical protein
MIGFVVAGALMLCDAVGLLAVPTGWVAVAAAPALVMGLLGYRYEFPVAVPDEVVVDGDGVRRLNDGRVVEAIAWSRLTWVGIVTTSAGPGGEDLYWLLGREDGGGCAVGSEEAGRVDLPRAAAAVARVRQPRGDRGERLLG